MTAATGALEPFFAPRSVAVLGASADERKWGNWVALGALEGADRRAVHLVNPRGGEVAGRRLLGSLAEAEGGAELVAVVVPERALEGAVDDALAAGARALVVVTAGLGERDEQGRARERALAERVRGAGARMLGPNCIGVFDGAEALRISSNAYPAGPVGLISQSGNVSLELGLLLGEVGLGFSRFASVGNQADVTLPELIDHLAGHAGTEVIAVYAEDVADGRAFVAAARRAVAVKPVVLLTAGRSAAGGRAARSHTGALVTDDAVLAAACEAAGVLRAESPGALADACQALVRAPAARGRRVLVVGDGGGHVALAADLAAAAGLEVPRLSEATSAALAERAVLGAAANPVDLIDGDSPDFSELSRLADTALGSGEVDAVLVTGYLGGYREYGAFYREHEPAEAARLAALQARHAAPVVAHSMYAGQEGGRSLRAAGLAVFARTEQAVAALAALARRAEAREGGGAPGLPGIAAPVTRPPDALAARALLEAAGLRFPRMASAAEPAELAALAEREGLLPAVVKAVDPGLLHKSELGGVRLGLPDARAVREAAEDMARRLRPARLVVEELVSGAGGVELVCGVRRDPRFGPVLLVGLGGVLVEVLADVAVALAPVDERTARRLLGRLRGAAVLRGVRGRPPVDLDAAAAAIAALSRAGAAHPELAELEVNPLLALPDGCVALDARAVAAGA